LSKIWRVKICAIIGGLHMLEEYEGFIGVGEGCANEEDWI
jgi:hypothetical protein